MPDAALVIFDCDGVLVDSERISHAVLHDMLAEMGIHLSIEETVQRFIGTSLPVLVERITQLRGCLPADDFLKQFASRTKAAFTNGLTIVPGVDEVLSSLTMPYCVASNGNHAKVNFTLRHTGLLPLFTGRIFTAEDVEQPKAGARPIPSRCALLECDTVAGRGGGGHADGYHRSQGRRHARHRLRRDDTCFAAAGSRRGRGGCGHGRGAGYPRGTMNWTPSQLPRRIAFGH